MTKPKEEPKAVDRAVGKAVDSTAGGAGAVADMSGGKSPAQLVGEAMLRELTDALGISEEEGAMMLLEQGLPSASEAVALKAAEAMATMAESGGDPEAYMADGEFLAALRRMPVSAAVELADARRGAATAGESAKAQLMEQLLARRSMPSPMKTAASAGARRDYANMSGSEFNAIRSRFRKDALNGKKPKF